MARAEAVKAAVLWRSGPVEGVVEVQNGALASVSAPSGKGGAFRIPAAGPCRLEIGVSDAVTGPGAGATVLTVRCRTNPFTFFLRDVDRRHPIWIPAYGAAVTDGEDGRGYGEVEAAVRQSGRLSDLEWSAAAPEETFESAARRVRELRCQTWLGLGRDIRIFELSFRHDGQTMDLVHPRFHWPDVTLPETDGKPVTYTFVLGRGVGVEEGVHRRLEDGALPIVRGHLDDGPMRYYVTAFATLERSELKAGAVRGTHYLVADGHGAGHMFTPQQQNEYEELKAVEWEGQEETVLCFRAEATNLSDAPRHAFFKGVGAPAAASHDAGTGFSSYQSGRVYAIQRLDGRPLPQQEMTVLVAPGESAVFEFMIPHRPISAERAEALSGRDFDELHGRCRAYWQEKLSQGAQVRLPERRIDEMVRAGLLHLDLVAYGREPEGTLAPTIGVYCPIGSESSPIIQFFDSMGRHDVARRAVEYFLDKQHEDGFIQNFGGYMLETGAALWTMGEHWRYTRDEGWARRIGGKVLKSCEYLLAWRERNKREELRGRGYGMIDGKVADPEDPFHAWMLNGYAYLGLQRGAEILAASDRRNAERIASEAQAMRQDIRDSFEQAVALAPVVPLRDGSWCPAPGPWPEDRGPVCLHVKPGSWWTHGCIQARDSMLGAIHLILQEVLDPAELWADFAVDSNTELFTQQNSAFSQPYYCRHDIAHIRRGEVGAFLKLYYGQMAALADRQTYTFWEHLFFASPHKTHEEGWFLMQTRWMLWLEEGDTLRLLPAAPRRWLRSGERIELRGAASYFGPVTLLVESRLDEGEIRATVHCDPARKPARLLVRLPHPDGRRAVSAQGGAYDPAAETVVVRPAREDNAIVLRF